MFKLYRTVIYKGKEHVITEINPSDLFNSEYPIIISGNGLSFTMEGFRFIDEPDDKERIYLTRIIATRYNISKYKHLGYNIKNGYMYKQLRQRKRK